MQTGIELVFAALLIYGLIHEEKVVAFEKAVKRIVVGHYRRLKRKLRQRRIDRKVAKFNGR
jgi:hypothetical protein